MRRRAPNGGYSVWTRSVADAKQLIEAILEKLDTPRNSYTLKREPSWAHRSKLGMYVVFVDVTTNKPSFDSSDVAKRLLELARSRGVAASVRFDGQRAMYDTDGRELYVGVIGHG